MSESDIAKLPTERLEKAIGIRDFMLGPARQISDPNVTLTELSERLRDAGVPLDRAMTIVGVLHAEYRAVSRVWEHGVGVSDRKMPHRGSESEYWRSPAATAHETGEWVVLWLPETSDDLYDIVPDLKERGYRHYICAPVFLANKDANVFTFATKAEDGFSEQDIALLRLVFPAIAACQEILVMHRVLREVVGMYVGDEPHRRILAGDVRRGEVMRIRSAILFADMRRFTELTSRMAAEEATALINDYYDCVVPAVEARDGEVLKFIGDGIMAIFRAQEGPGKVACAGGLAAARDALTTVARRNEAVPETERFEVGVGLHFGEVAYGNVGSGARLDYTVIGRDVNVAARVAGLCGTTGKPLLLTSSVAERLEEAKLSSLGPQVLKGIPETVEVYEAGPAG